MMARRLGAGILVAALMVLPMLVLGACSEGDPTISDGDTIDGDATDVDDSDGDLLDGDEIDGDLLDGDVPDGDLLDGDAVDGDATEDGDQDEEAEDESISIDERHIDWVNPFIGTGGVGFGFGSGVPGPKMPFGMIYPSPDTMKESGAASFYHFGGYYYEDDYIVGFAHTHLYGVGANDLGNILFTPSLNEPMLANSKRSKYRSEFRKETEYAMPGYYTVTLDRPDVIAELTATARTAFHRYHFPALDEGQRGYMVIDLGHCTPDSNVSASNFRVLEDMQSMEGFVESRGGFSGRYDGLPIYFAARFSKPIVSANAFNDDEMTEAGELAGEDVGAYLGFDLSGTDGLLEIQVAISYVSAENAWLNLNTETDGMDFDTVRAAAEEAWETEMDVLRVEGGTPEERTILSTALYHAAIMPNLFMDVNGEYLGFDKQVHTADGFAYYTDFSMWDTYRSEHPFLHLTRPERSADLMTSLLKMAEQGGYLPKWPQGAGYTNCMVGTPADIVMTDAYLKGVEFDAEAAYNFMLLTATKPTENTSYSGRSGVTDYVDLGYVSVEGAGSSVSCTMEYAVADYSIYLLSQALGKPEDEIAENLARSKNYANLWDSDTQFFRGKTPEGDFVDSDSFDPLRWQDYFSEGDAWQYLWLAPHDPHGLIDLFGSKAAMETKLTDFFELGKEHLENRSPIEMLDAPIYYWHGNEPDIHAVYLFNEVGRPDLAQKWADWISRFHYNAGPDGIAGNDDCGTLSSWYIFSSVGLFPVAGTTKYWIGRPLFPYAELKVSNGTLIIEAPEAGGDNIYVQSATLNGEALTEPWLDHADIKDGGTLHFTMGSEPSAWGTAAR
jgi:predicted alpha-1,2-mannosidase